MMTPEEKFAQCVMSDINSYDCDKVKNGRTIRIQIFDKIKGCTSTQEKEFRKEDDAIKYINDIKQEESE